METRDAKQPVRDKKRWTRYVQLPDCSGGLAAEKKSNRHWGPLCLIRQHSKHSYTLNNSLQHC